MNIIISAVLLVLTTIGTGMFLMHREQYPAKWLKYALRANIALGTLLLAVFALNLVGTYAFAETTATAAAAGVNGLGLMAAAVSTGLATIGAGYAVGAVGSSAIGAISEDPKNLGKTLIYVGLAEGIAIYGLIVSILILGKL